MINPAESMIEAFKSYLLNHEQKRDFDYEVIIERLLLANQSGHTAIALTDNECIFIGQYSTVDTDNSKAATTPLVQIGNKLAIRRHFLQENAIAKRLQYFAEQNSLDRQLPKQAPENLSSMQQKAYEVICQHNILLLTGGPGTGKTSTVAAIIRQFAKANPELNIRLTAPTGKASLRLLEALSQNLSSDIKVESQTIHRLLQYQPYRQQFSYHQNNPLTGDLFVIDEASMISTTLFYHLLQALPHHAKVIIAGDPFQLPAVEQGQVLKDITQHLNSHPQSSLKNTWIHLNEIFRFSEQQGIHKLSQFVQQPSNTDELTQIINQSSDITWLSENDHSTYHYAQDGYRHYFERLNHYKNNAEIDLSACFEALNEFRVLCAVREGAYGVYALNESISKTYNPSYQHYFHGQPIMVTENNYDLGLFNGDIGIIIEQADQLYAYFEQNEVYKRYPVYNLPQHETAFAITVHKSQGSEMDHVLLVIPEHETAILSSELLYTGITRAKKQLAINANMSVFIDSCKKQSSRDSCLHELL